MRATTGRDCDIAVAEVQRQFDSLRAEVLSWEPEPYPPRIIDCTVEPDQERIYADGTTW